MKDDTLWFYNRGGTMSTPTVPCDLDTSAMDTKPKAVKAPKVAVPAVKSDSKVAKAPKSTGPVVESDTKPKTAKTGIAEVKPVEADVSDSTMFKQRVRRLVTMTPVESVKFVAFLKTQKSINKWSDADIIDYSTQEWQTAKGSGTAEAEATTSQSPLVTETPISTSQSPLVTETPVSTSIRAPEPVTLASAEFHLNEANKKLVTATSIVSKAIEDANRATVRAEEAMKIALDLKTKAAVAQTHLDDSRELVAKSQQEVEERTVEHARVSKPLNQPASVTGSVAVAVASVVDEPLHLARKNIPKSIKTLVWNKHIGPDVATAKCVSCRTEAISIRSFHCGHVIAESKGGDTNIANLRPVCAACNLSMGVMSMNEFTTKFFGWSV